MGGMVDTLEHLAGTAVLVCAGDGPMVRGEADALDLIAEAGQRGAAWTAVPVGRLADEFFQLRNGIAGAILQKFVNYGMGLAVLGDLSRHTAGSSAVRDLVRESNRGRHHWFLPDLDELEARLSRLYPPVGR
jgi:hypothetical protein